MSKQEREAILVMVELFRERNPKIMGTVLKNLGEELAVNVGKKDPNDAVDSFSHIMVALNQVEKESVVKAINRELLKIANELKR